MLGGLYAQMYIHNQATAYPPGLQISKATDVTIVADKVCSHLPIRDATKKKGFKLNFYDKMHTDEGRRDKLFHELEFLLQWKEDTSSSKHI